MPAMQRSAEPHDRDTPRAVEEFDDIIVFLSVTYNLIRI